jgi:hypothetical protein
VEVLTHHPQEIRPRNQGNGIKTSARQYGTKRAKEGHDSSRSFSDAQY